MTATSVHTGSVPRLQGHNGFPGAAHPVPMTRGSWQPPRRVTALPHATTATALMECGIDADAVAYAERRYDGVVECMRNHVSPIDARAAMRG